MRFLAVSVLGQAREGLPYLSPGPAPPSPGSWYYCSGTRLPSPHPPQESKPRRPPPDPPSAGMMLLKDPANSPVALRHGENIYKRFPLDATDSVAPWSGTSLVELSIRGREPVLDGPPGPEMPGNWRKVVWQGARRLVSPVDR